MGLHVLLAAQRGLEGPLAVGAHVGPQVAVDAHVAPQAAARAEGSVTHQALEGLQPRVRPHVRFEHARRNKASSTLRALERLLPRVRSKEKQHVREPEPNSSKHSVTQNARAHRAADTARPRHSRTPETQSSGGWLESPRWCATEPSQSPGLLSVLAFLMASVSHDQVSTFFSLLLLAPRINLNSGKYT